MKRKWEVVLTNERSDERVFAKCWTLWGAKSYQRWLCAFFPDTLNNFFKHGYLLGIRRIP